ncbi:MAG: NfeD family protein [Solirubrobacterales bacterium]
MEAFVVVAIIAVALLLAELLLPTGGVLAALGAIGLVVGGILALGSNSDAADYVGPALIALGVASAITFYVVARKVVEAHERPVRGGPEDLVGAPAEARSDLNPEGQVLAAGGIWAARLAEGSAPVRAGDRVRIEAVEGLTLTVRSEAPTAELSKEGAG